jgi:hypothetical protein
MLVVSGVVAMSSSCEQPLDMRPWTELTPEQQETRKMCLSIIYEIRWDERGHHNPHTYSSFGSVNRETFIETVQSAIIDMGDHFIVKPGDSIELEVGIIEDSQIKYIVVNRSKYVWASIWYNECLDLFFEDWDPSHLDPFNEPIIDRDGVPHTFETNPDHIKAMLTQEHERKLDALIDLFYH